MAGYRPTRFHVGMMRDRIIVANEVTPTNETGQPVVTLVNWLTSEPATYVYVGGAESIRGRQIEAGINAIFTVRYRDGYVPTQVITYAGQRYGVVHVRPVDGKNRYLELFCKAVVN
jgi:SPP1 family predicted phage head-tail adaptor